MSSTRVGDLLLEADLISEFQLKEALRYQQTCGGKTVGILLEQGALKPDAFYRFLARRGIPAYNPLHCRVLDSIVNLLPYDIIVKHEMLPVDRLGRLLTVAMVYPFDIEGIHAAEALTGLRVKPVLCRAQEFQQAIHSINAAKAGPADYSEPGKWLSGRPGLSVTAQSTIARIRALKSLPISRHTKGRFAMLRGVGGINMERAASILSRDPVALAYVLAAANAREWTQRKQIADRHEAIRALGLSAVIETIHALDTMDSQLRCAEPAYIAWRENAVAVAETAGNIAQDYAKVAVPGIYEAALLHSIGALALLMIDMVNYPNICTMHPASLRMQRELELYGITEADAGAALAETMGLPEAVVNSIRHLHSPESSPACHDAVAVTSLAHHIVQIERNLEAECTEALRILGLTPSSLRNAVVRLRTNISSENEEI